MRYTLTALILAAAPVIQAQETAVPALGNAPQLMSAGYLAQVVGSLAIVFGAVVLMAMVVKRVNRSPSTGKGSLVGDGLRQCGDAREGRADQCGRTTDFGRRGAG